MSGPARSPSGTAPGDRAAITRPHGAGPITALGTTVMGEGSTVDSVSQEVLRVSELASEPVLQRPREASSERSEDGR